MSRRRAELADFLRSRRERVTPAQAGLPPGPNRRTPGLRREEVALLSGIGVTWYTWLEQGRRINVSGQVLDAVARTLNLDRAERAHLYRLAEVPEPEPADTPTAGPPAAIEVQAVLDQLAPYPACVLNARYDVLAWNTPYGVLWRRTLAAPAPERNVLWSSFTIPACCSPFGAERDAELADMVAAFRAGYARHLGDPHWSGLVERLSAASAEFAAMWAVHDVTAPVTRIKVYRHASAGDLSLMVTAFDVAAEPETRMLVYTPASEGDLERVRWLLAHPDAPPAPHTH